MHARGAGIRTPLRYRYQAGLDQLKPVEQVHSPEHAVRRRLATLYGVDTADWEHLATYTIEGALPAMAAPHPLIRGCRVGPGRYVCGDHQATGSVQGALASGARAAREILAAAG